MKTLLILAPHPDVVESIRAALDPARYRILHRADPAEAEPFLERRLADCCLLDLDLTGVQSAWTLEKLSRRLPGVPLVVLCGARSPEWEEDAYLQGAAHVLTKPVRARLLNTVLDRLCGGPAAAVPSPAPVAPVPAPERRPETGPLPSAEALIPFRSCASLLPHALDAHALSRGFLRQLRDLLGLNRAALFLHPPAGNADTPRTLQAAASFGLPASLLAQVELSLDAGLGAHLQQHGRILQAGSPEALADAAACREFAQLGVRAAVPILDRESLVGIAMLDGRVTGEPLAHRELEMVFHLLEEFGLAIRNLRHHEQLARNHEVLAGVLRELGSACLVVGRNLDLQHANKAARQLFGRGRRGTGAELEFSDLPPDLGAKVFQVLQTGAALAAFPHAPAQPAGAAWMVTIVPLRRDTAGAGPEAALLVIEDQTQAGQLQRLEAEAAGLRLIKNMADRIAHEVGNAMVPLSTHQQLLAERYRDAEFRASLDLALSEGVKRVNRLIHQMRHLARDTVITREKVPLGPLLEEAFKEAHRYQPVRAAKLHYDDGGQPVVLSGDRTALRHALAEVFLNAIQANPGEPKVRVTSTVEADPAGGQRVHVDVTDTGEGFPAEAARKVPTPFFTTRTVGLGLGLCVVRKILEIHAGRLLLPPAATQPNVVRLTLPLAP